MPQNLKRYHHSEQSHFITFSCHHRRPLFQTDEGKTTFEIALERIRQKFDLRIYAYVIMPEHVHLLVSEPEQGLLSEALKSLKQGVSRRLLGDGDHFWQKRYYDFNVRNAHQFSEKLRYIHRNPVKRGLCKQPEDWQWSSFRHYATGVEGRAEIESEWTARKREQKEEARTPAPPSRSSQQKA
jgi:putative transposase